MSTPIDFGLFQGDQRGGGAKLNAASPGVWRAGEQIVIRPAAADEAVAGEHVGLRCGEFFPACLLRSALPAARLCNATSAWME